MWYGLLYLSFDDYGRYYVNGPIRYKADQYYYTKLKLIRNKLS